MRGLCSLRIFNISKGSVLGIRCEGGGQVRKRLCMNISIALDMEKKKHADSNPHKYVVSVLTETFLSNLYLPPGVVVIVCSNCAGAPKRQFMMPGDTVYKCAHHFACYAH